MAGRSLVLVVLALAGSAVVTHAAGRKERAVPASSTLRLPNLDRCVKGATLRVTLVPPAGAPFASVAVRAGSREVLQLTDLNGPGSVVVALPPGTTRISATATTTTGRYLEATRRYRRCSRATAPAPARPAPTSPEVPDSSEGSSEN